MPQLPIPPQERAKASTADFEVVSRDEAIEASGTGGDSELAELFQKLETGLVRQATVSRCRGRAAGHCGTARRCRHFCSGSVHLCGSFDVFF